MGDAFDYMAPEQIVFGDGGVERLGTFIKELRGKKAFIVTDKIVGDLEAFQNLKHGLEEEEINFHIYDEVDANPTDSQVAKGANCYKEVDADILIAVGGGSSMDSAKAIGILASNGGDIRDYQEYGSVVNPIPPLITVPTTAGTGSEVSAWAVVTNTAGNYKMSHGSVTMMPKVALVDPLMTVGMPPAVTAATGIDALSHAIEAVTSPFASTLTDYYSFSAIKRICKHIGVAFGRGSDIRARGNMALGALEGGLAMNAWCGGVHALGHQLSTQYKMPHGIAMGIMMPYVMNFNIVSCMDQMAAIASAMGQNITGLSPIEAAKLAPLAVVGLLKILDMPTTLDEYGCDPEGLSQCAKLAMEDSQMAGNPRIFTYAQVEKIFQDAFEGNFQ